MTRTRVWAVLAGLIASLVMTAGLSTMTAQSASAAPHGPYPPQPSTMTVNRGTVQVGGSVRVSGRGFGNRETVRVSVFYKPLFWDHYTSVLQDYRTRTDRRGGFSVSVRMVLPGRAVVIADGLRSGKGGSAPVRVLLFNQGHGNCNCNGGGWRITRAGYTYSGTAPVAMPVAVKPAPAEPDRTPALAAAALGVVGLTGGVLIKRRRRRA
jgi:hypothetical protein